jgi:hypothetical protein
VKLRVNDDQCELELSRVQFQMIDRVVRVVTGGTPPGFDEIVFGIDNSAIREAISQGDLSESEPITLHLSGRELHGVFSALLQSLIYTRSEEAFFYQMGFFRENVEAVLHGIIRALMEGG